jgi:D-glycero-beta-D-manno-heptose-7-phosphate kinase
MQTFFNNISIEQIKQKLKQTKILVVGDVMLDRYWMGDTTRISPEAPVPVININTMDDRLGGAANVAANLADLGVEVGLLGCIGQDEAGLKIQSLLTEACINTYLQSHFDYTSIIKLRIVARQQQMLRLDFEKDMNEELLLKIEQALEQLISQYQMLIVSDYNKGCLERAERLIAIAQKYDIPVLVDPKDKSCIKYRGASILTPNFKEFQEIVGNCSNEEEMRIKAQNLCTQLNLKALVVTRSEKGMTLFTPHSSEHFHAKAKEVFDVSGAGDTVIAVLAAMFNLTGDINLATSYANIAGGIVVGKLGTSVIHLEELFVHHSNNV